ncbi:MAG: sterol desaturase family protein [Cytophagales bacterium]|nr:sterol desaturase family protein [Cytophagales bacterium]
MEAYVAVLNYAIPFFLILLLIEVWAANRKNAKVIRSMDTLSSLSSGMTNSIKDVLGLTVVILSYRWVEARVGLFDIEATWYAYVLAFIGIDFAGYWSHRLNHQVNYFWNHHIIHHSSEEFNLGCALRQTVSAWFSMGFLFLFPTAVLGVPPEVIAVVQPLHLFAQYWYHTRLIDRMGFLEKIIVTPSHHRVHHAINEQYLDKNLSQIFIIWDKLFGTFQEELKDVPPIYGVKRPVRTWNPILINFQHLWQLIKDAWRAQSWWDKARIWFMPTGWRPEDVAKNYPLAVIQDVYAYEKYDPSSSFALKAWSWTQWVVAATAMMYMFNSLTALPFQSALMFGLFLVVSVFSYTMLMDRHQYALLVESVRVILGLSLFWFNDWFLLTSILPFAQLIVITYLLTSWTLCFYFSRIEKPEVLSQVMA